jgi:hypothetical protein
MSISQRVLMRVYKRSDCNDGTLHWWRVESLFEIRDEPRSETFREAETSGIEHFSDRGECSEPRRALAQSQGRTSVYGVYRVDDFRYIESSPVPWKRS